MAGRQMSMAEMQAAQLGLGFRVAEMEELRGAGVAVKAYVSSSCMVYNDHVQYICLRSHTAKYRRAGFVFHELSQRMLSATVLDL